MGIIYNGILVNGVTHINKDDSYNVNGVMFNNKNGSYGVYTKATDTTSYNFIDARILEFSCEEFPAKLPTIPYFSSVKLVIEYIYGYGDDDYQYVDTCELRSDEIFNSYFTNWDTSRGISGISCTFNFTGPSKIILMMNDKCGVFKLSQSSIQENNTYYGLLYCDITVNYMVNGIENTKILSATPINIVQRGREPVEEFNHDYMSRIEPGITGDVLHIYSHCGSPIRFVCEYTNENTNTTERYAYYMKGALRGAGTNATNTLNDYNGIIIQCTKTVSGKKCDGKIVSIDTMDTEVIVHHSFDISDKNIYVKDFINKELTLIDSYRMLKLTCFNVEIKCLQKHTTPGAGSVIKIFTAGYSQDLYDNGYVDEQVLLHVEYLFEYKHTKLTREYFDIYYIKTDKKHELLYSVSSNMCTVNSTDYIYRMFLDSLIPDFTGYNSNTFVLSVDILLLPGDNDYRCATLVYNYNGYGTGSVPNAVAIGCANWRRKEVLSHEFGHAFASFGDEYTEYGDNPPSSALTDANKDTNLDITGNADRCKWADLLKDPTFDNERINGVKYWYYVDRKYYTTYFGYYEGGGYYSKKIYRSALLDLMLHNIDYLSPQHRRYWYYTIMRNENGRNFTLDYNTFVEFDKTYRDLLDITDVFASPMKSRMAAEIMNVEDIKPSEDMAPVIYVDVPEDFDITIHEQIEYKI